MLTNGAAAAALYQSENMEHTEYQQIMDRLEGRILCYQNAAARKKAGQKQYTATQMELAKAKAMQEARIIVWMHHEGDSSESKRDAHVKADESPERQAYNAIAQASADARPSTKEKNL